MKNITFLVVLLIILIVGAVLISNGNNIKTANSTDSNSAIYFDDNAPVMYFWKEDCIYCKEQTPILEELSKENNLKVKSMDVGINKNYWTDYKISGTPSFIAPDGERLEGLQEKAVLKAFLEKYQNAR